MIVWINGAFGAGKTTLADVLRERLPESLSFDPEYVGYLLRQSVPDRPADFQDIPLWRRLTAELALGLYHEYQRLLVVPMTLVNPTYRDEIFSRINRGGVELLHVFLDVPAEELKRRIDAQVLVPDDPSHDANARQFRINSIQRCVTARAELPKGTLVLRGDQFTPEQLADWVLAAIS